VADEPSIEEIGDVVDWNGLCSTTCTLWFGDAEGLLSPVRSMGAFWDGVLVDVDMDAVERVPSLLTLAWTRFFTPNIWLDVFNFSAHLLAKSIESWDGISNIFLVNLPFAYFDHGSLYVKICASLLKTVAWS